MTPYKKYKRVKKNFDNANPLFEKWLTEWYEEAVSRGWKSSFNYKKALSSLKKYPLPLKSGKEAQVLENFGVKICQMLDDKLKQHVESGGDLTNGMIVNTNQEKENSDENGETHSQSQGKSLKTTQKREYVPVLRSGPYALLIALYKNHQLHGANACMKKAELMDAAQPFSEKSFRVPEVGCYYTAWSSMGLIIRKGLVIKESNPAKYFLTDHGKELAEKILQAENKQTNSTDLNSQSSSTCVNTCITSSISQSSSSQSSVANLPLSPTLTSSNKPKFIYCYVSENGNEVREKDQAVISIRGETIGFLIKSCKDNLLISRRSFRIDMSRSSPTSEYIYAFLDDNCADEIIREENFLNPVLNSQSSTSSTSTTSSTSSTQFSLRPEQFEIVLCVDNCETLTGDVMSRKLIIQNDLRKNGVNFDIRKLNIGDYVWIAKEKVAFIPGQLRPPKGRELVLDYVVERKRMDDLAGSIKDGRFHEQKFRLKECGLRNVIYLVEEIGSPTSLPESTLLQAISNTQVVDGFIIKRTKNVSASVTFLTIMTRRLQKLYSNKILSCCSKEDLINKDDDRIGVNSFLTFEEFYSSSIKNRDMTVRDMFVKQLLQLNGLSIDKVLAIIEKYPTPLMLMEAYKRCESIKDGETLLANLKFGINKRNIGPSVSKTLYHLYTKIALV